MKVKRQILTEQEEVQSIDIQELRQAISKEYEAVAETPDKGFHFHTGRRLAGIVEYDLEWLESIPEYVIESFAGTGNPFAIGIIVAGESVLDLGCGAGIDTFIAAKKVIVQKFKYNSEVGNKREFWPINHPFRIRGSAIA